MKFLNIFFITTALIMTIGIIFRGWIYRELVTYKSIGLRTNYPAKDKNLIQYIDNESDMKSSTGIEQIIELALYKTSNHLNYTTRKNSHDPNQLIYIQTAHCVGYASFFTTTSNFLLKKYNFEKDWTVKHHISQLYLIDNNIHKFFNSPFFKDHDFVTIENEKTGEVYSVDPTISDYLYIDYITYRK